MFVFFVAVVGELVDAVAALTAVMIALVKDSSRAVTAVAGTPPTSGAGAGSTSSPPVAPLGLFLRVDIVSFVDRSA